MNDPSEMSITQLLQQSTRLKSSTALWNRIEIDMQSTLHSTSITDSNRILSSSASLENQTTGLPTVFYKRFTLESLFSLAACLVLLSLPWGLTRWSLENSSLSNDGNSLSNSEENVSVNAQADLAFDDETLTWLASLGEVNSVESYEPFE